MLATVFYMQPIGYVLAALVTLAVTWGHRDSMPRNWKNIQCDDNCIQAVDRSWRIIIGIGAAPALIAVFFRRSIPESPLYTADVLNQPGGAFADMNRLAGTSSSVPLELEAQQNVLIGQDGLHEGNEQSAEDVPPIPLLQGEPADEDDAVSFSHRWKTYWSSFQRHFIAKGFWWSLLGVSFAWLFLDASYYALGSSSSTVVTKIFNSIPIGRNLNCTHILGQLSNCTILDVNAKNPDPKSIYDSLCLDAWGSLVIVCAGSLIGGGVMIGLIKHHSPRNLQIVGFMVLLPLFLIAGLLLINLSGDKVTGPTAIFYFAAQVFFEVGPNFTTFILPVIFPTRHRAFAHGIAAGSGKLGGSLFQIFFQFVKFHHRGLPYSSDDLGTKWLGYTVLCFMPTMVGGVIVTWFLVPYTRQGDGKSNMPLDELETLGGG